MRSNEYTRYIRSDKWLARKRALFKERGRYCEACKSGNRIDVHHKSYGSFGDERSSDLAVLCRDCHDAVHRLAKRMPLDLATEHYIEKTILKGNKGKSVVLPPFNVNPFRKVRGRKSKEKYWRMAEAQKEAQEKEKEFSRRVYERVKRNQDKKNKR